MTTDPRSITILGSTGSVGCSTLSLVAEAPERFVVEALTAKGSRIDRLAEQARRFRPRFVAVSDPHAWRPLKAALGGTGIEIAAGAEAVVEAAGRPAELVMAAVVGAAGLRPTLAAIDRGATVALANKECLVCAGDIVMERARRSGAIILPVDSEHSAIFQVFDGARPEGVERIILTASGGPFRAMPFEQMRRVSPAQALAHPNWEMGDKITIDSATMMNKGLELIEAAHLFPVPAVRIEILVHPESVVHSMVAYRDGSVLAQLGLPDMRTPIAVALAWPERMPVSGARLDFASLGRLTFEAPDPVRFPALRLAREALVAGRCRPAVLNAANEVAVAAFLAERIGFLDIIAVVESTLAAAPVRSLTGLADVVEADMAAREIARGLIGRIAVAPTGTAH
ncbi:1-deoxy-D-xylulose-5-phosphate reductoisomerase [Constrictibacter sp. MBR-5]